jgi:hypothetical protein
VIKLELAGVGYGVADGAGPNGPVKILQLVDQQSGIVVVVPFEVEPARQLAAQLSGIVLARDVPKPPMNGHGSH